MFLFFILNFKFKFFMPFFFHGLAELQPQCLWLYKRESEGLLNPNVATIKCEGKGAVQLYGNINKKVAFFHEKVLFIGREDKKIKYFLHCFSLTFCFKAAQQIFGSQITLPGFTAPFCVSAELAVLPQHDQHSLDFFFCIIWILAGRRRHLMPQL